VHFRESVSLVQPRHSPFGAADEVTRLPVVRSFLVFVREEAPLFLDGCDAAIGDRCAASRSRRWLPAALDGGCLEHRCRCSLLWLIARQQVALDR
jgi:hypothetical protein